MKQALFHSDFARVTVMVNGMPLAVNAEVDVTLKRPAKLDKASAKVWDALKGSCEAVSMEGVPANGE